MKSATLGLAAVIAALSAAPASAGWYGFGYAPPVYEARHDYGSTYVDTYVDGIGAGVVVHEKSYVGLNNEDPSIRYKTALDGCLYGSRRFCDPRGLTIDDRYRLAAARTGGGGGNWSTTNYRTYGIAPAGPPSYGRYGRPGY